LPCCTLPRSSKINSKPSNLYPSVLSLCYIQHQTSVQGDGQGQRRQYQSKRWLPLTPLIFLYSQGLVL
jgi:hypothetical protein